MAKVVLDFVVNAEGLKGVNAELQKTEQRVDGIGNEAAQSFSNLDKALQSSVKNGQAFEGIMEGIEDALQEAGIDAKTLAKEFDKFTNTSGKGANNVKSLTTQFRTAKNEAAAMIKKFGEFSPEAIKATREAARLKDEISYLDARLDALNPKAKLTAIVQVGAGIAGAFTAAQGALALFGEESEEVEQAILKVQAALALSQGLNSVLASVDAFKNLRAVIVSSTAAQRILNLVTKANPILLIVSGILAAGAAIALYTSRTDDAKKSQEELNAELERRNRLQEIWNNAFNAAADKIINDKENELKILEAQNANQITLIEKRREIVSIELALFNAKAKNKQLDDKDLLRVADLQTQYKILGIQIDNLLKRDNVATSLIPRKDQLVQIKQDLKKLDDEITANMFNENEKRKAVTNDFYENQRRQAEQAAKDRDAVEREITAKTEQLAFESINAFAEISAIAAKEEEAQLKDQLDRKVISEAEYNRQVRKLRQEQAEKEKAAKIAEITLAGILAVQNALSQPPGVPITIPLALLAGSLSAIQLAKAIATPIPKFAKGIEMLSGAGTETSDSIMAYLSKGERVVPANINREYFPALSAIHNKKIKAKDINEFAIGGISATIDEYALARLINRNRSVTVTNLSDLAKLFQHNARRV